MDVTITINEIKVDEWLEMRQAVGFPQFDSRVAGGALRGSVAVIGIKIDGKHIGMLRILGDKAYSFYLNDVIIIPQFQNRGLGKRLIKEAFRFIKKNYCNETMFSVSVFSNIDSKWLYEKENFFVEEEIPMKVFVKNDYYGTRRGCLEIE